MKHANLEKVITLRVSKKLSKKLQKYCQKKQLPPSLAIRRWMTEKLKHVRV